MDSYLKEFLDSDIVAVDTEWAREKPWCLSFSIKPGTSRVVMAGQHKLLDFISEKLSDPDVITVVHNALYDLPVLSQMGVEIAKPACSMVMAYLLQDEPQGLKALAFRHVGMEMSSYKGMVETATYELALQYLLEVDDIVWPDPEPVLEWKDGEPHVRQPQNMKRKTSKILKGVFGGDNPAEKWKAVKDGKEIVELLLGKLQEGELCDIDNDDAVWYAARDADATIRILPILWARIQSLGLEDTFWRDMRMMPMVVDMMANGMPVDLLAFAELSDYFQSQMSLIQRKIQHNVGHLFGNRALNPASYPQMSELIYDKLALHVKGGSFKSKGGAGKKSTANDILKRYVRLHPVVQDIMDYREYQKLKTSYADAIPKLVSPDGRVRTTMRITRVATGRLSSSRPNLMAQPTRSEEGRKVRDCYETEEGKVLMSGDYCLDPNMRVLTHDYRWVKIEDVEEGDLLWGVDESAPKGFKRKCRLSIVESTKIRSSPKFRITMADGSTLVCTKEHPWLARKRNTHRNGAYHWVTTEKLDLDWEIWKPFEVWESKPDWESGYLAGLFDADGSLSFGRGVILTFIQNAGPLLDNTFMRLVRRGYDFHIPWLADSGTTFPGSKRIVHHTWISNRKDIAKFLGEMRPQRLIDKAWPMMEGRVPPQGKSSVIGIEELGIGEVIALQTSSKTFMSEGFITHNSQVEMRVAANDSRDEKMMSIFWEGIDIHSMTASDMFGVPVRDLDEMKHRYPAKRVGFGILNLITAEGLHRELISGGADQWTVPDCEDMIQAWFKIYSGIAKYMKQNGEYAKRYGYVRDMWGRVRYIPGIRSTNRWIRIESERQAGNAPIQMGAQGIIKEAMGQLVPVYRKWGVKPLIQIHDDIVWELGEEQAEGFSAEIGPIMVNASPDTFVLPLEVDFKVGRKWGSMKKLDSASN